MESKISNKGAEIFAKTRCRGHLLTNLFAAVATAAFVWMGRSTNSFSNVNIRASNDAAFNIMLPLAIAVTFAFARWQQIDKCHDLDEYVKRGEHWEDCIIGNSLRNWDQCSNAIYLVVVNFTATATVTHLFGYTMGQAKKGDLVNLSWQLGLQL